MIAFLVTTGRDDDTQTYGVIVAPDETTAQYHLDRAQLNLARQARRMEQPQPRYTIPVLHMERVDMLNEDVLVQHSQDDPAMPAALPGGMVASS